MQSSKGKPLNTDEYIAGFPPEIQEKLNIIRETIRKAAPEAQETISYQIPTFTLHGNLVHFAAMKNHIGFYPAPSGLERFGQELAIYRSGKGSVQFPYDQPIPLHLVTEIVKFRVKENMDKAAVKARKRL
jgi:uncharacterized protein YdhG (YjbR/CyaY superfamily)